MDVQDHKKATSSVHEIHGVHHCHKCGWPFPNPHPSAKHRRAHKRVCGKTEGYKLIDSEGDHADLAGSDNEHLSDDEHRTPSHKVEKKELGSSTSGGTGVKSSRSEDELFSDAVTDFSDNGVSPSLEERLESVKKMEDKDVRKELLLDLEDNQVSREEKTGDTSQPLHDLIQPSQGPEKAREMSDSDVVGIERNQSEVTEPSSDFQTENVSAVVSSASGLESDSSQVVSKSFAVKSATEIEIAKPKELISSGLGTDIKEKRKSNEALDAHLVASSEVLQSEHRLEIEHKLQKDNVNSESSNAGPVDEIVHQEKALRNIEIDQEKALRNDLQSKHDVSSQIQPPNFCDASVVSELESDSAKRLIHSIHGQPDMVCNLKEAGSGDAHNLSAAKTFPAVENPDLMIGEFKDYKMLKSSFAFDLGAAKEVTSIEDDKKVPLPVPLPENLATETAKTADISSSEALEDYLTEEGVPVPIDGEVDNSVPEEDLSSAVSSFPPGTVDDSTSDAFEHDNMKEDVPKSSGGEVGISVLENLASAPSSLSPGNVHNSSKVGVSVAIDGEAGNSFPKDLSSSLSSFPAETVDNSSSDAFERDNMKEDVSKSIGGETRAAAPQNLGSAHSSLSPGNVDNSSKAGISVPIDGEVGSSVPEDLSSFLAGTIDNSSSDTFEHDNMKEDVSKSSGGEVGISVPENLGSAHSSLSPGNVHNSSKVGISVPIDGEIGNSVPENLSSALSSFPAGTVDNSSCDAFQRDNIKEDVSKSIGGEVGTAVPQNLASANSSLSPGHVDGSAKAGISVPIDGEVGNSVPEDLSSALLSFPAGTVHNSSSSNAFERDNMKEDVSKSIGGEVDTYVPENLASAHSSLSPGNVDNSSKASVSVPIDGEVENSVPEDLSSALSNFPAGTVDNSSSDAFEHDNLKEDVPDPVGGKVDTSVPENLASAYLSVPAGNVDISSSEALEEDLKEGDSTPTNWKVGTSIPENLSSDLPSVPAGTAECSSLEAMKIDRKKEDVSVPIDGEVGNSAAENLPSPLSSLAAETAEKSSLEAFADNPKEEGVSTPIDCKVATSAPENFTSAHSSVPPGDADNSSSEALEDHLEKEGVSTPIDGEVGDAAPGTSDNCCLEALQDNLKEGFSRPIDCKVATSVPKNLPTALSNIPAGNADDSAPAALKDDLKEEGVSTTIDRETGNVVPENLDNALSSFPAGTADNISSEALQDDLKKEGASTPIGREVGTCVPENLPCALSNLPAGLVETNSSEALQDELRKEAVSVPIGGEADSSGSRVKSDKDTHLLSGPETLPAVENPEAMIRDFKDNRVLKSNISSDLGATEEIGSVEDDKKELENLPIAAPNVLVGSTVNSPSDTSEDDLQKGGPSVPIMGEVDVSGFGGKSDKSNQLLSVTETSPAVENPEFMVGDFKEEVLKGSTSPDLGAAEEIRSAENNKVTIPGNLPNAPSNDPAGRMDKSFSDASDNEKDGVSIPIDGESGASGWFSITGDADIANHSQPNNNLEESQPQSVDGKSLQNEDSEPGKSKCSDVIPLESPTDEQTQDTTNLLYEGENANKNGIDRLECVTTENGNVQAGKALPVNITTTLTRGEVIPETTDKSISLRGEEILGLEKSRMDFSSTAGNETVETAAEEKLVKQTDASHESTKQLLHSASLDEDRGSQVDIEVIDSAKLSNSSESLLDASEGHEMFKETEVPRSSVAAGMVPEQENEDPAVPSEKTWENSNASIILNPSKTLDGGITAIPIESEFANKSSASIEDMNIDAVVSGPLLDDGKDKVAEQNFSVPAVDNSFVSSSRNDSLEGNWGSISVLSTQSDVTAVSSTDTQAAEKLNGESKKPHAAAMEPHPDKSDVFEPPSFMTLVESGVRDDKNAAALEIQMGRREEQKNSEALQAGWFPSLTNVANESEGRKKNEEMIAKVTNWNSGKQHSPLKNLLNEAHAETKVKSPSTKQTPAVNQGDETASKNNSTTVTTVGSILGTEMPADDTVKKEMEKEWNSPARYPIQIKKEKRKGKPYWVPFVCCASVHQDI